MKQFVILGEVASKKNNKEIAYKYLKGGKKIPFLRCSDRYNKWHASALEQLLFQKQGAYYEKAKLLIKFYYGTLRDKDADNGTSSVFDTLVNAGILKDDNWKVAGRYFVDSDYDKSNPRVEIKIYDLDERLTIDF